MLNVKILFRFSGKLLKLKHGKTWEKFPTSGRAGIYSLWRIGPARRQWRHNPWQISATSLACFVLGTENDINLKAYSHSGSNFLKRNINWLKRISWIAQQFCLVLKSCWRGKPSKLKHGGERKIGFLHLPNWHKCLTLTQIGTSVRHLHNWHEHLTLT